MLENVEVFIQADPLFYEDPRMWSQGPPFLKGHAFAITGRDCPPGWRHTEHGLWRYVFPEDAALPEQGWKVHASGTLDNGDAVCSIVWDYCTPRGVPFKYLRDRRIQYLSNSKYASRASSGKLVTIYPRDDAELHGLLRELGAQLRGYDGPYILSDLRWEEGPLYVRYGGFAELRCPDADGAPVPAIRRPDGTLVADRRRPFFDPPEWVEIPDFLAPQLAARKGDGEQRPYQVEKALHFSNSGGVYLARSLADDTRVVLKEARPHAGVDGNGEDAVARQHREEWALGRLAGIGAVPRLHDSFTLGGHRFLVQQFREGLPLYSWCSSHHPLAIKADPGDHEIAEFTERALAVQRRVAEALQEIHARGLVFGDLHMNNVLVGADDEVSIIDFEQSFDESDPEWRPGLAAPGFGAPHRTGRGIDEYALAMLRLTTFLAFTPIAALDRRKFREYLDLVHRTFPVPGEWLVGIERQLLPPESGVPAAAEPGEAERPRRIARRLARGIVAAATPDREDRLFPGDIQQFAAGGLGFAYGAAGVLWALETTGHGRHPEFEQWLIDAARRPSDTGAGFYDGMTGVAYVLDHLGHHHAAGALMDRVRRGARGGISLFSGLSGIGATWLHLARRHGDAGYEAEARDLVEHLCDHVAGDARAQPSRPGLMRGWTGVALFLLRAHEHTGDPAPLDAARTALHRDLDRCVTNDDGALMIDDVGNRGLPHLESGASGLAVVAEEYLAHREDDRLRDAVPRLVRSCYCDVTVRGDLFFGKAGQLATLARVGGEASAIAAHAADLRHYLVDFQGELALASGRGFRLSMDVATGGAGVLLALAAADGGDAPFLPFFSDSHAQRDGGAA